MSYWRATRAQLRRVVKENLQLITQMSEGRPIFQPAPVRQLQPVPRRISSQAGLAAVRTGASMSGLQAYGPRPIAAPERRP